ncbi:riboflavin kinase [Kocuria nitroreducens]|uniref:riboflavin kinase n=1 Tax=Kocuria nitroreducens TaxID=3058914 RepID=UPI0036D86D94
MTVIEGVVEHGDARGRTLGFPTANIALTDLEPADGVWAAQVRIGSEAWAVAAVSVGRRRTFYAGEGPRLLEAHLLDVDGNLYGQTLRIELITQLREQQSFPDVHALTEQLHRDVEDTRAWAAAHCPWLLSARVPTAPERELG